MRRGLRTGRSRDNGSRTSYHLTDVHMTAEKAEVSAVSEQVAVDRPGDGIVQLTLNRPEQYNALTFAMFDELTAVCAQLERDPSVRVVVLTGAAAGFCAGLDLDDVGALLEMSGPEFLRGQEAWAGAALAVARLTRPVIAAVNGPAAGAGFSLAL